MSPVDETPEERRERTAALHQAIEKYMETIEFSQPGMMLGDWILVGNAVYVDEDGDPNSEYFVGFSGGTMLQHVALGLMIKGKNILECGELDG